MDPSGKSKGPPPAVKKVLGLFGSGREEDRMVGYLSFLKIGPKLLRFLPGTLSTIPARKKLNSLENHPSGSLNIGRRDAGKNAWLQQEECMTVVP